MIWHIRIDGKRRYVGGQALKNDVLDSIWDGWVWMLDDDCTAHPLLYRRAFHQREVARALIVSQQREDDSILHAAASEVEVGKIDIGQAILARDLIGDHRIPETYAGDGMFLEAVLAETDAIIYLDEVLSHHNNIA